MEARNVWKEGPAARLIADYHALPGVPDELLDGNGQIRPVWTRFIEHFARISPDDLALRFGRGEQYLRDAGVFYRQYDPHGSTERGWPMARIPVLIEEAEWNHIAAGLRHRAELLEALAADLYGPNRLVAGGHLPASLIAGSREWLRPLVHVPPRGGNYLHFIAFEIGRGPDGTWWVLGDLTQAPSGAGLVRPSCAPSGSRQGRQAVRVVSRPVATSARGAPAGAAPPEFPDPEPIDHASLRDPILRSVLDDALDHLELRWE